MSQYSCTIPVPLLQSLVAVSVPPNQWMVHLGTPLRYHILTVLTQGVERVARKRRLTREQDETRLQGLRILARMIVRAHLASLRECKGADGCVSGDGVAPGNGLADATASGMELSGRDCLGA